MLDGIRVLSKHWIGRAILTIVMGFIIVSFAIWGIGDMLRGFRSDTVGEIGGAKLTGEQVRTAYQNELTRIQRQLGRAVSNDQARQLGVDRGVVDRIVDETVLDQQIKSLGLTISDAAIAETLRDDPAFKDASGAFDPARFQAAIRDAGFNEQTFVQRQREVYTRREIADAVTGDMGTPDALLAAMHRYRAETRTLDVATLTPAAAGQIAAPTDAELQTWFDAHKSQYRAPSYRKVALLTLAPADIAKPDAVSAADAQKFYDANKDRFGSPERRRLLQIVYQTEDEAKAAAAKLAGGASFDTLLADKGLKEADVDLGLKTKPEFFDKAIAEAGFALAPGATVGPIKGEFGYAIIKAAEVQPAAFKPFAEVEPDIRRELAQRAAADHVRDIRDRIEDERASGRTLTDAAKSAGLTVRVIDAIDATGHDAAGALVPKIPDAERVLRAVFSSDVGVDNDVISTKDREYVWFDVLGVTPARDRTLAEVRDKAVAAWTAQQTAARLREKADALLAKIRGGESFDAVAKAAGLDVRRFDGVRREGTVTGLSQSAATQAFNVKVGEAGSAAADGEGRSLFVVRASTVPPLDAKSAEATQLSKAIAGQLSGDVIAEYVARLRADARVRLDQPAIDRAMFGSGEQ